MGFFRVILTNVLQRKVRSGLAAAGVAAAVAAVVALQSLAGNFEQASLSAYRDRGVDLVALRAGVTERLSSNLKESLQGRLAALPGVAAIAPVLSESVLLQDRGVVGAPLHGWPAGSFAFDSLHVTHGHAPVARDKHGVLLGSMLARTLHKKAGDMLTIEDMPFRVCGIFESRNVMESGAVVMLLPDLQALMDRPGQVTEFQIRLAPEILAAPRAVDDLRREVRALHDRRGRTLGLEAIPTGEYVGSNARVQLAHALAWVTSTIALLIGSAGMVNTMLMSVLERTHELGVLRALGWRRSRIVRLIVGESLVLSLAGAALGVGGAWVLTDVLGRVARAGGMIQAGMIPAGLAGDALAIGVLLAFVLGVAGSAYPAWKGAGLAPAEALRYDE